MITQDHPFFFLAQLFTKDGAVFHFSKYVYKTDTLFDEREFLSIAAPDLTAEWVNKAICSLRSDQELALHSKVSIKERTFHIPMVDFSLNEPLTSAVIYRMRNFLPREIILNLAVFESGRSFHAYSAVLIPPKKWTEFMGRLLLINPRNDHQVIDTRWIGHRLIGGFSSLRWSNNTGQYLELPRKINFPI